MAKRAKKPKRVHKGGRPANPIASRLNCMIDPDVKRRVIITSANDGVPFHKVLDAALRRYLDGRGVK
jgi:hypothetical protein